MTNKDTVVAVGAGGLLLFWLLRPLRATVTTDESFDLSPYGVYPEAIKTVARAIARAEGFYVPGSVPQRAHNPGDLKLSGRPTINGISVFDSDDQGWAALYRQLSLIVNGQSRYNLDMSIDDMARTWTTTEQSAWAANVAQQLGVAPSTALWEVLV